MVATVADPVASRMSTARSQASNSIEMLACLAHSASIADPGVHQHLLETRRRRDDQDDAATGGSPDSTAFMISARVMPRRDPT
jgi:hypothetical protein